jgi:hypothetical protein
LFSGKGFLVCSCPGPGILRKKNGGSPEDLLIRKKCFFQSKLRPGWQTLGAVLWIALPDMRAAGQVDNPRFFSIF